MVLRRKASPGRGIVKAVLPAPVCWDYARAGRQPDRRSRCCDIGGHCNRRHTYCRELRRPIARAARPASVQERWFSRIYFVKPIAFVIPSLFWLITGLIVLGPGYRRINEVNLLWRE